MKPADRTRLTQQLRDHVGRIAADLKAKLGQEGPARARARALHQDEQVGEDFDVWLDLLSRRAAVLWVLKSVYVRVLEDRGLLTPGRLLDRGAQELFDRLAPKLGPTAFLRWVYRDLASAEGGLPELFAPQPAEVVEPSNERSADLLTFWRAKDPDSGFCWSFAEERFEGELMGDLYQELDPVVKQRYALCQTPDFVRGFILDRTLTPALAEYGVEKVRLLDPACGSGHFLIDGLKRLVAALPQAKNAEERRAQVQGALRRVVGMDLNDYACALARARLVMTAAELAGEKTLAAAAAYHPQVYWADGLEQVEKDERKAPQQLGLLEPTKEEPPRAVLTRPEVRAALRPVLAPGFEAVVANPPYITEKDPKRKEYHREKVGKKQRYVSAYREYSLASPFTERCFQLAVKGGFVGLITSNNFMKREFGAPLIEQVLAGKDLTLVVDTSQAYIPFHGTPTVLLFGQQQAPQGEMVAVVMGKRGETGTPDKPAEGKVWTSIGVGWNHVGFDSEYVSVASVARTKLATHPWSLGGGGVAELKDVLEQAAQQPLSSLVETPIGRTVRIGADELFVRPGSAFRRLAFTDQHVKAILIGEAIRDWAVSPLESVWYPYPDSSGTPIDPAKDEWRRDLEALWPWRVALAKRATFQGVMSDAGLPWFAFMQHTPSAYRTPLSIAFACIASSNHFVLDRGGKVFKQSAPVIKLPVGSSENDHLALLGLLNSSVACFWMKQVFYPKASGTKDIDKVGLLPENNRYDFSSTGMLSFPVPAGWQNPETTGLARTIDTINQERAQLTPAVVLCQSIHLTSAQALRSAFAQAEARDTQLHRRMVFLQEELDWLVYRLYGLIAEAPRAPEESVIDPEQRPFCWQGGASPADMPPALVSTYRQRRALIDASPELTLLETPVFKRLWRGTQGIFGRYDRTYQEKANTAMYEWLAERIESAISKRSQPATCAQLTAALQAEVDVLAVAEILTGRGDFHLQKLIAERLAFDAMPNHPFHVYSASGLQKREAWEQTWEQQRREDAGEKITPDVPPAYTQGDFQTSDGYRLRGKLDVPKERFIAFTEVPGRDAETLYGWAGWTPLQRIKAMLQIDEDLDDAQVPLSERIALLDSAWRLLPTLQQQDAPSAARLRAELQAALSSPDGPSATLLAAWKQAHPTPAAPKKPPAKKKAKPPAGEVE